MRDGNPSITGVAGISLFDARSGPRSTATAAGVPVSLLGRGGASSFDAGSSTRSMAAAVASMVGRAGAGSFGSISGPRSTVIAAGAPVSLLGRAADSCCSAASWSGWGRRQPRKQSKRHGNLYDGGGTRSHESRVNSKPSAPPIDQFTPLLCIAEVNLCACHSCQRIGWTWAVAAGSNTMPQHVNASMPRAPGTCHRSNQLVTCCL